MNVAALVLAGLAAAPPATADEPCAPTVSATATPALVPPSQPATLTVTVHAPCDATSTHSVSISARPTGPYGPGEAGPAAVPVATVTTAAAETATATVTVRPERDTDYLYGLADQAYSTLPFVTVHVAVAPGPPPPTLQVMPRTVRYGQPVQVTATGVVGLDLYARTPDGRERLVRSAPSTGPYAWMVFPAVRTSLFVRLRGYPTRSPEQTVEVASAVSLTATRTAARTVRFTGRVLPQTPDQPVRLHRLQDGRGVLAAVGRTAATR